MGSFFKGWRRKVGCVTLVMALTLAGAWIRSFVVEDYIAFPFEIDTGYWSLTGLGTGNQSLDLYGDRFEPALELNPEEMPPTSFDLSAPEIEPANKEVEPADALAVSNGSDPDADDWVQVEKPVSVPSRVTVSCILAIPQPLVSIPFSWVVIPLTLVSAYLILPKPKTEPTGHPVEPPHA